MHHQHHTVFVELILNHQMVDQNLFKAVLRPFSLASPDSSLAYLSHSAWPVRTSLLAPESHRPERLNRIRA